MSKSDKELFVECAAQVAAALTPIIVKRDKSAGAVEYVANFASVVACEIVEKAHTLRYETTHATTETTALAIAAERHAETVHVLRARIKELEFLFDKVSNECNALRYVREKQNKTEATADAK